MPGTKCPFCKDGRLHRGGSLPGRLFPDKHARPLYRCNRCGEGVTGKPEPKRKPKEPIGLETL